MKKRIGQTNVKVTRLGLGCEWFARPKKYDQINETFQKDVNQGRARVFLVSLIHSF